MVVLVARTLSKKEGKHQINISRLKQNIKIVQKINIIIIHYLLFSFVLVYSKAKLICPTFVMLANSLLLKLHYATKIGHMD